MTLSKPKPDLSLEAQYGHPQVLLAGVDEVGRGCLAGPVYAAAVILPAEVHLESWKDLKKKQPWLKEVNDSKLVAREMREELAPQIRSWARAHAVAFATVEEIDRINIHHASHLAMIRAIRALGDLVPHQILIDGKFVPRDFAREFPRTQVAAVVKGDQKSLSIACASILAKVERDSLMIALDAQYPGYGLADHKGYSTPAHKAALAKLGACVLHRRSFSPVREALVPEAVRTQESLFFGGS